MNYIWYGQVRNTLSSHGPGVIEDDRLLPWSAEVRVYHFGTALHRIRKVWRIHQQYSAVLDLDTSLVRELHSLHLASLMTARRRHRVLHTSQAP